MAQHGYIALPPDGAGKKLHAHYQNVQGEDVYNQIMNLGDPEHFDQIAKVGPDKALYIRFAEGSQQFNAFGDSKVAQETTLGQYVPFYDLLPEDVQTFEYGTSEQTACSKGNGSSVIMTIGTAPGDMLVRETHKKHLLNYGSSQLVNLSITLTDAGKQNVRKRVGYFSEEDGAYFEQTEAGLAVGRRSSMSGSPVDFVVPRSEWDDPMDGTGESRFNLIENFSNNFWIDVQQNLGRIRWGVQDSTDRRVVAHTFSPVSQGVGGVFATCSLPLRWEIENTGTSPSISQLRIGPAFVVSEGYQLPTGVARTAMPPEAVTIQDTPTHIWSMRLKAQFKNKVNYMAVVPKQASVHTGGEPVVIMLVKNATLTGAEWNVDVGEHSGVEGTVVGTCDCTGPTPTGQVVASSITSGGDVDFSQFFDYLGEYLRLRADGTSDTYSLVAKTLTAATTADVFSTLTWKELS